MKKIAQNPEKPAPGSRTAAHPALEERPFAFDAFLRTEKYRILAVAGLALAVRIAFFFLNKHNNPLFHFPIMDGLYHDEWAKKVLAGDFWGSEVFFRAPLYPYLLALAYKVNGSSIAVTVFMQHIMGTLSAALVFLLARFYFRRSAALIAGLLAALYWPLIYFEGQLLMETLVVFLDLLFLVALSAACANRSRSMLIFSGVMLGLSAIARPSILAVAPAVPFIFHWTARAADRRSIRNRWFMPAAAVYAVAALVIAPVLIRNYAVGRDFVPIASQGGVNFYIGNNPKSDGRTAIVPGTRPDWWGGYYDSIAMAEESEGRKLKPSEVSNHFFRKGLSFIVSFPAQAGSLFLRKFVMFWSGGERSNNMNIYFFWRISGMGHAPLPGFWLICPLGLLGVVLLWKKRTQLSLFYGYVLLYSFGVITFFVNDRFRLPVVPVLIVFAAAAIVHMAHLFRSRSRGFALRLIVLALITAAVNIDFATFKENKIYADSFSHYSLGNAYLKMKRDDLAMKEYEIAHELNEKYPVSSFSLIERGVHHNLGTFYWRKGLCKQAIEHLSKVGGYDSYAVLAKRYLAECYAKEGIFRDALRTYEEALALDPKEYSCLVGMAGLLIELDDTASAREALQRAQALYPNDPKIRTLLGSLKNR
ncbi:MAG: glycosyltransferase family 39 protein [Chitinivibrionia bacterium]|nr:glycosyltransferase family 39 protein [Chitinivibrionia bacterium]